MPSILWIVLAAGVGLSPQSSGPSDSPRAQFERQFIGIDEYEVGGSSDLFVAYQGKYKRPLEGADFYDAVLRPDLAARYRSRVAVKTVLKVAGPVSGVLGLLYAMGVFHSCAEFDVSCKQTRTYVGLGMIGGGVVANWVGYALDSDPVSRSEARELVDQYNTQLRDRLQLQPKPVGPAPVVAAIIPVRGGATAALAWTF